MGLTIHPAKAVDKAYGMCDSQANAAPETHATLTATLVVVSGSFFVPNTKTTSSTKSSHTTSSSTSIVLTKSSSSTATPTSTLAPSTSTSSFTSSTAAAATTTTSTPTSTAAAAASKKLSAAQIGGIAGGVAAAAILAALLALFILLRRRRRSTGFSRVRDSWTPKHNHMGSSGSIPTISAPMYEEPKVMSFTRALAKRVSRQSRFGGTRPGTIGLAISPARGTSMRQQQQQQRMTRWPGGDGGPSAANATPAWAPHAPVVRRYSPEVPQDVPLAMSPGRAVSSFNFFPQSPPQPGQSPPPPQQQQQQQQQPTPLSPPQPTYPPQRPNLTVEIPPTQTTRPKRASTASNRMATSGRDSIVTEFAEDGEDMTTSALGSALIWRPPTTDANSAATYYVADKWGNWVLGGTGSTPQEEKLEAPAGLETPISKTAAEREADEALSRHRKQVGTDIAKHSADLTDSEAVKAAMRHLSSPTIPESVALRNMDAGVASGGEGGPNNSSTNRDSIAMLPPFRATIRLVTPESGRLPINARSGSVYSNFDPPQSVAPGADNNPMPKPPAAAGVPAGVVTVSKRASRAYPAATRDPTQLGIHPALRPGNNNDNNNDRDDSARLPSQRKSNNGYNNNNYGGGRRDRSQTMMSQDSTTTIASSVGDSDVDDFPVVVPSSSSRPQRQSSSPYYYPLDLSPVIESPGRSPVQYPQIPRSRSSAQMYDAAGKTSAAAPAAVGYQQQPPPAVNPVIRKMQSRGVLNPSSSSDSPTLGVLGSQRPHQQQQALPKTNEDQGQISYYQPPPRTGSPNSITGGPERLTVVKKHQRAAHQQQQQPREPSSQSSYSPSPNNFSGPQVEAASAAPHPQSFQTRIHNRAQLPSQSHAHRYGSSSSAVYDAYNDPSLTTSSSRSASDATVIHTPPHTTSIYPSSATGAEASNKHPASRSNSPHLLSAAAAPSAPSPTGSAASSSTTSALLAKRLGPEKAARFIQVPVTDQRKWARRQSSLPASSSSSPQQSPPVPAPVAPKGVVVRRVVGPTSPRNTSEESNKENAAAPWKGVDYEGQGYENETQTHEYYLPATPGWKPQLTPKRRGDDLYLSVQ